MYTVIDGKLFKNMLVGAYQLMSQKYDIINQLNVFPVPDGDTGNNMLNTLRSMYSMIGTMDENEPLCVGHSLIVMRMNQLALLLKKPLPVPSWGPEATPVLSFPRLFMVWQKACMARRQPPVVR